MKIFPYFALLIVILTTACAKEEIYLYYDHPASNREQFAIEKLSSALEENNFKCLVGQTNDIDTSKPYIYIGNLVDTDYSTSIQKFGVQSAELKKKESYSVQSSYNKTILTGFDDTGVLYGCLKLIEDIKETGQLPKKSFSESPEMVLRGAAIGLQKPEFLPGRDVYEYPLTPENFPWFYDKELWIKYLDLLVENRFNSLYLWNGHPFASLVQLDDYPYAVEVNDSTFKMNKAMYDFISHEADKRGIWVIQMFYNIIVSKTFADYHNIETQDRSRPIIPIIADYTRKSIAEFIENYPNVGLMVCLGEAMNTIEDDVEWFTKTIIPGVKDGLDSLGKTELPPIVLRGHDTDAKQVIDKALPLYNNLYTTYKYNGESLTTYNPRGEWVEKNRALSSLGSVHISNVHILANLEPFRYGSPDFIKKSVQSMHNDYGANGLHLYPQASYWDWPYAADNTSPRLLQIERDWIWYKAWGRYAWKVDRKQEEEIEYWSGILDSYYGCPGFGKEILTAYIESGEIAPKLLRRFGISDGNRQTLLLGMFMSQLVNPYKWRVYQSFYDSNGPEGEILLQYAKKEWNGEPHSGETPVQIIEEVIQHASKSAAAIRKAEKHVSKNKEEFKRLSNDIQCMDAFACFFSEKVEAALKVLNYKYSADIKDLEEALQHLEKSIEYYSELVRKTEHTYLYANSMQTRLRRIPADGIDGINKNWKELLPQYIQEKENLEKNIEKLKNNPESANKKEYKALQPVKVEILSHKQGLKPLKEDQAVYLDKDFTFTEVSDELKMLKYLPLSFKNQKEDGTVIQFKCDAPVKVVTGYFNGQSFSILSPPTLETNAHANDHGQADIRIANALDIDGLYPVNLYTYYFEKGEHTLKLGKGIVLILGFMDGNQEIITHDAGMGKKSDVSVDWLFY
jgi:hypothetical protein